jgi:hypothetical protein
MMLSHRLQPRHHCQDREARRLIGLDYLDLRRAATMKRLLTTTVATWMCSGAAFADHPLTPHDVAYVIAAFGSLHVMYECPGFAPITGGILKLGDSMGVDTDAINPAIEQAMRLGAGMDYDRSKLIPGVTRLINQTLESMDREAAENKPEFCKRWSDLLVDKGLIQRKPRE